MTNERLTEIRTTMYQDASTTTLSEFIDHAIMDFESRVVTLYNMSQLKNKDYEDTEDIKKTLYTTRFYDMFKNAGSWLRLLKLQNYRFKVNPKNINFETTLTNLREEFENELMVDEVCQSPEPPIRMIKDIPDWQNLFGKGEFPYMTIYVFRLGNTEYFAYEIHR